MAALTGNRPTQEFGGTPGGVVVEKIPNPIADNVHIYQGALVQADANGNMIPAGTVTNADSHTFRTMGMARKEYDNTVVGHAAGAFTVEVQEGAFLWDILGADAVTQADVGNTVYAEDDHTIRRGSNGNTRASAGRLLGLTTYQGVIYAVVQTIVGLT